MDMDGEKERKKGEMLTGRQKRYIQREIFHTILLHYSELNLIFSNLNSTVLERSRVRGHTHARMQIGRAHV